jgi:hypothetical protein
VRAATEKASDGSLLNRLLLLEPAAPKAALLLFVGGTAACACLPTMACWSR